MVACFKPQKSPLDFVEVASRVLKETDRVHFIMAGDGELRPAVEARIRDLGISSHMTLLGWREDMPEVYRTMDVGLSATGEGLAVLLTGGSGCRPAPRCTSRRSSAG